MQLEGISLSGCMVVGSAEGICAGTFALTHPQKPDLAAAVVPVKAGWGNWRRTSVAVNGNTCGLKAVKSSGGLSWVFLLLLSSMVKSAGFLFKAGHYEL